MYVVCVRIQVVPGREDDFIAASQANAAGTRQEPGNVRWDLLRHRAEPDRFALYEAYREEADFTAHQQTEHYLKWKEQVAPMMAVPRIGDRYTNLTPWE
ncbi:MAG TPA: antibiotic biosynthesis monooxygenase [Actinomycetota bacterium]|nr:antibiotic biosynthesis monooxygenase [Actinomycetota bacterium]